VGLKILGSPDGEEVAREMRDKIAAAIEGARIEVTPTSPGHFEIRVESAAFAGKGPVQRQQLVYRAITPLMTGDAPPVHAIDRMHTSTPE